MSAGNFFGITTIKTRKKTVKPERLFMPKERKTVNAHGAERSIEPDTKKLYAKSVLKRVIRIYQAD